mgnify:CR=1 FL=1
MSEGKNRVLIVSKPLAPPWNDSSKNLARGIVDHARRTEFNVLTVPGFSFSSPRIVCEPVYRTGGDYAPSRTQNLRVLLRLARPDPEIEILHFFFAPNPVTSTVCRWLTRFKRKKTVQSVCSPPASYENLSRLIFTDVTVVLSDYHLKLFRDAGIDNVIRIYPGVEIPEKTTLRENLLRKELNLTDQPVILYPGDYEFSGGHEIILEILPRLAEKFPRLKLIFACRPKTDRSRTIEAGIRKDLGEMNLTDRVIFMGTVEDMEELYDLTAVCLFPARSLYKKMDLPLTLLECLARGIPVITADIPPVNEAVADEAGVAVDPEDPMEVFAAVSGILEDPDRLHSLGKAGQKRAAAEFDIIKIAARYEELYRRMVK